MLSYCMLYLEITIDLKVSIEVCIMHILKCKEIIQSNNKMLSYYTLSVKSS